MQDRNNENTVAGRRARKPSGPRVIVGGVVVKEGKDADGNAARPGRRLGWLIGLGSFALAFAIALAAGLLASCSGKANAVIRQDGGLRLQAEASVPAPLAAKLRALSQQPATAPIFVVGSAEETLAGWPGLRLVAVGAPDPDSMTATLDIADLGAFLAEPRLAASGAARLSSGPGWKEFRVRLERGSCEALVGLLPGLDPGLMEALSPPALDPEPITRAEYRRMLAGIVGEKAVAALEGASYSLRLATPGPILASSGGRIEGQTLVVSLPAFDLLVLEKPMEFSLRWKAD